MNEQALNEVNNSQQGTVTTQDNIQVPPITVPPVQSENTSVSDTLPVIPSVNNTESVITNNSTTTPVTPTNDVTVDNTINQPIQEPITTETKYSTVNDPYVKKIYDWAQSKGRVTVPYDQFKNQWFADDTKASQLYDKLYQASKYEDMGFDVGKDFNSFKNNVSFQNTPVATPIETKKQTISEGVSALSGGIEKAVTDANDNLTKLPEHVDIGQEESSMGNAIGNILNNNPAFDPKNPDKVLSQDENPNLSPLQSFGMTEEFTPEQLSKDVPILEQKASELESFINLAQDWQKNHNSWDQQKLDDFQKQAASYKAKYDPENTGYILDAMKGDLEETKSSLAFKKKALTGEGELKKDPLDDLNKVLVVDVKANYNDPDYEEKKKRWIENGTYTPEEITLAENKYVRDQQDLKDRNELFKNPSSISGSAGFYAQKKMYDDRIQQGLLEHQTAFQKKLDQQYGNKLSQIQSDYQTKATEELNISTNTIQQSYQKQFQDLINNDPDAKMLTDKFREKLSSASPEQKLNIQKQYNDAIAILPEVQKLKDAQAKEIKDSQNEIVKKYDDLLKDDYNSVIGKAQDDFQNSERSWVAKQYDPVVNNKETLTKWTDSVKKDMNLPDMDFGEKKQLLNKEWSSYLRTQSSKDTDFAKKMSNPTLRKQAEREFYFQFGDQLVDKKGQPTIYGIKSMVESQIENINDQMKILGTRAKGELSENGNNVFDSESLKKLATLTNAKSNLEKILTHPETDESWYSDLWNGLTSKDGIDYIPFIATFNSISKQLNIKKAADKLADGKPLSFEEQSLLSSIGAQKQINSMRPTSLAYNVGNSLAETLPSIGEFVLTGKSYSLTKKGVTTAIERQITKGVEKSFERNLATGVVESGMKDKFIKDRVADITTKGYSKQAINGFSTFVGSVVHTAHNPQQVADKLIQRMTPEVSIAFTDEGNKMEAQLESKGEDFWKAFAKATGSTWADMVTERMGGDLMKMGENTIKKITGNPEWLKRSAIGSWMTKRGIKNVDDAMKIMQREKLGWNGIIEENLEEYAAHAMDAIITGDHSMIMTPDEMLNTALTTAALGGGVMKPIRAVGNEVIRRTSNENLLYEHTDSNGEKKKEIITLPKTKWDKYSELVNDKNVSEDKIRNFVDDLNIDDRHKDALIQNYFVQNKPKLEGSIEQTTAKETTVPKPETMEKTGFESWKENQGFSQENPVSLVPQEVFDVNSSIESGKTDKEKMSQEDLYKAEQWARNTRDQVVKNDNLSEDEKTKSLEYLNNVISNIETGYEMTAPAETKSSVTNTTEEVVAPEKQTSKTIMPEKPNITVTEGVKQEDVKGEEGKDYVVVKQKNLKKNQEQTKKIIEAQKVISTPVYTSQDLFEKAVEANVGRKDLEKQHAAANAELAQIRKRETNLGSFTTRKKNAEIKAKQAEISELDTKITEAKKNEVSAYGEYAKARKSDPKIAFAEVNDEIEFRKKNGEPIVRIGQPVSFTEAPKPKVTIDSKAARNNDIADLKSGKKEMIGEVLDSLSLTENELKDAKKDLDLKGSKATDVKGLFDSAKKRGISVEKFYDTAKKYRNRDYTKQQQAKEKEQEAKKAEKKQVEEKQKSESTKASAEGTIIDTKTPRKKSKKTDIVQEEVAARLNKKYQAAVTKVSEKLEKATADVEAKTVDEKQVAAAMKDPGVKKIVSKLKELRKNIREIKSPADLNKKAKIDDKFYGEFLIELKNSGVITEEQKNALQYEYSDIVADVTALHGLSRDANNAIKQAYLFAKKQGAISAPEIELFGQEKRMPAAYLEPTTDFLNQNTEAIIQGMYKKVHKALSSMSKRIPGKNIFSRALVDFKLDQNGRVLYGRPNKAGSPVGLFDSMQKQIVAIGTGRNNYDVFAHEIGHELEANFGFADKIGLDVPENLMNPIAQKVFNELKVLHSHGPSFAENAPKEIIIQEGIAEFVRAVSINEESTKESYPNMYGFYAGNVATPGIVPLEVRNLISEIGKYYRMSNSMTTWDDMYSTTGWYRADQVDKIKNPKTPKKVFNAFSSVGSTFKYKIPMGFMKFIVDDRYPVQKVVDIMQMYTGDQYKGMNDPKLLMSLISGVGEKANAFLYEGFRDKNGTLKNENGKIINYPWMMDLISKDDVKLAKEQKTMIVNFMNAQRFIEMQERQMEEDRQVIQKQIDELDQQLSSGKLDRKQIDQIKTRIMKLELDKENVKPNDSILQLGSGTKSNTQVAKDRIAFVESLEKTNPDLHNVITETARRYRVVSHAAMEYLVDKGKMSQSELDEIAAKNQYYVSFKRITDEAVNNQRKENRFRRDMTQQAFSIKKAEGSSLSTADPFMSLIDNVHRITREADRNELLQEFTEMIGSVSEQDAYLANAIGGYKVATKKKGETIDPALDDLVKVYKQQNGETVIEYWKFDDSIKTVFEGLDGLSAYIPVMTPVMRFFKKFYTSTPKFIFDNFFRDTTERFMTSMSGSGLFKTPFGEKYKGEKSLLAATGGSQSYTYESHQSTEKLLMEFDKSLMRKSNWNYVNPISWLKSYSHLLKSVENSNRVLEFAHSREKYFKEMYAKLRAKNELAKKADLSFAKEDIDLINEARGHAMIMAAYNARNLMDFYRGGSAMKYINQVVPFANAGIQGTSRYMQSVQRSLKDPKYARMFVARNIVFAGMAEIAFKALQDSWSDDEESLRMLEQQDYLKRKYWTIPTAAGDFTIAKPYSGWIFGNLFGRIYDGVVRGDEFASDDWYGMAKSMEGMGIPIDFGMDNGFGLGTYFGEGSIVDFGKIASPMMVFSDLYLNRTSYGGTIVPPEELYAPVESRSEHKTNFISGMLERSAGIDARMTDNAIRSFGQWGKMFNEAMNYFGTEGNQPTASTTGFFRNDNNLYASQSYSDLKNKNEYKFALKGTPDKYDRDQDPADFVLKAAEKEYYNAVNGEFKDAEAKKLAEEKAKKRVIDLSRSIKGELNRRIKEYGTGYLGKLTDEQRSMSIVEMEKAINQAGK